MAATSVLRFQPEVSGGVKQIVIPVHYLGYVSVLLWVWVAVWGLMEAALAWGFVRGVGGAEPHPPQSTMVLGILLLLFTAAGAFMIWRLLWVRRGREILQVTRDRLILRREPAGGEPEVYDRSRIRRISVGSYARNLVYPSWGRQFIGKGECYVSFDYEGKTHEIARGLSRRKAEAVALLLQEP